MKKFMIKIITFISILFLFSCSSNKKINATNELPSCLHSKITTMSKDPREGMPKSVTRYKYKGKTVYYLVAACCDKYNIVFDSDCNVLGFPDGGFTGKGDGKMPDFHQEASDGKVVWQMDPEK